METVDFQWLDAHPDLKQALQQLLNSSGQQLKKYYSSKELARPVRARELSKIPLDLVNHLRINPLYSGPKPSILQRASDYLVIHKPPGIHSHPHSYSDKNTLVNFLASEGIWDVLRVNEEAYDRGLLFRLDFETSGLMLVARNQPYYEKIRQQFKEIMRKKYYWAIVEGDFNQEGMWQHYFKGTGAKGSKQRVQLQPLSDGDLGEMEVRTILRQGGKSLLLINLKSGLRHQIRAQLSSLGFPILGDELYGGRSAERLYLHALRYEWVDQIQEDPGAELFDRLFDLNRALEMTHDMLRTLKSG